MLRLWIRLAGFAVATLMFATACASGAGVDVKLPIVERLQGQAEPKNLAEALSGVKGDVLVDLDAAMAIAVAHNDLIAQACYPVLKKYVSPDGSGTASVDQIQGVLSGFEKARVERKAAESKVGTSGVPDDLRLGCAALVQDERDFVIRMGLMIGGASMGAPGAAGAVGGILKAVPGLLLR